VLRGRDHGVLFMLLPLRRYLTGYGNLGSAGLMYIYSACRTARVDSIQIQSHLAPEIYLYIMPHT
jgi:hypothetical protein